jgi:acyl-CoA synthetase (AMP-forming)/AMP-acid ligase II
MFSLAVSNFLNLSLTQSNHCSYKLCVTVFAISHHKLSQALTTVNGNVVLLISFFSVSGFNRLLLSATLNGSTLVLLPNRFIAWSFRLDVEVVFGVVATLGVDTLGVAYLDISTLVTDGIAFAVFVTLGVEVIVGVVVLPLFAAAEEDAVCCCLAFLDFAIIDCRLQVLVVNLCASSAIYV